MRQRIIDTSLDPWPSDIEIGGPGLRRHMTLDTPLACARIFAWTIFLFERGDKRGHCSFTGIGEIHSNRQFSR